MNWTAAAFCPVFVYASPICFLRWRLKKNRLPLNEDRRRPFMSTGTFPRSAIPAVELGDDSPLFEIIDGKRVELPPMSSYAVRIANIIAFEIQSYARANNLGE